MPDEHSKFDGVTGKWLPTKPCGVAIVRKSAGWIDCKERFIWVIYVIGNGKRAYIRGHSESLDPKALDHAKANAQEIQDVIGGNIVYRYKNGIRDTWYELPTP